jgi:hypothetical protein
MTPFIPDLVEIGVTDTTKQNLKVNIVWSRRSALEGKRAQRIGCALRSITFGRNRPFFRFLNAFLIYLLLHFLRGESGCYYTTEPAEVSFISTGNFPKYFPSIQYFLSTWTNSV